MENLLAQIILSQEKADYAKTLLLKPAQHELFITDYSLCSIGLLLFRRKRHEAFRAFIEDILINGGIGLLSLLPDDMGSVISASQEFDLDFDDAYQYAIASTQDFILVSFDTDFRRTDRGYKTPSEIM